MKPRDPFLEKNLCKAINSKHVIELGYKNDVLTRTLEPYIVFEEPGTKNITLAGWQEANANKPLDPREWRKFTVGLIADFKMLSKTFRPDPVFSSYDSKIYGFNIFCAVDR